MAANLAGRCVIAATGLVTWLFGGNLTDERLARAEAPPYYEDRASFNAERQAPLGVNWGFIKARFFGDEVRVPPSAISVVEIAPTLLAVLPALGNFLCLSILCDK